MKDSLFGFGNILLNFNANNVKMNIQEANFLGNDGTCYSLNGTLFICNEKFKKIQKESKSVKPILKQFDFFLSSSGISLEKLSHASYKVNRASKGVKTISVSFIIEDPVYAYGLGAVLSKYRGYSSIDLTKLNIQKRIDICSETMCDLISFNEEKSMVARQIASIEKKEFRDVWKEKFYEEWSSKLETAKKEGISYHKLKDKFNINQYRIAS